MPKLIFAFTLSLIFIFSCCQSPNDLTLPPNTFSPTSYYHVYYEFSPPGNITIAIQFDMPNQYFGLGLGTEMTGADIWAFQIVNGEIVANDYHGVGHSKPVLDVTPAFDTKNGGHNNIQILGTQVTSTSSFVKFTRALNTGDTNDDNVIQKGATSFIWATRAGSPTLGYHGANRGSITVDLV